MIAPAGGLAFSLGGRKTAAQIVNNWYSRSQQAALQLAQPAAQSQPPISGSDHARTPQTAKYSAGGTTS
jgi:hypothetical protein